MNHSGWLKSILREQKWLALVCAATLFFPNWAEAADSLRQGPGTVEVSRAPGKRWSPRPVRTLLDLPTLERDVSPGRYGGFGPAAPRLATGFFKTRQVDGRWWLIDPEGRRYIYRGVSSVRAIPTRGAKEAVKEKFGSSQGWAKETVELLHGHGFNGVGAWSDDKSLRPSTSRLAYTKLWSFMSSYGKKRGGTYQKPGHTGYPGDCPFIFDPEFPTFCQEHARQLLATRDDPWLVGHFTDNELPWSDRMLGLYLELPKQDPGYLAADRWLKQRHGENASLADITQTDREDFLAHAADTYFSAVCSAIRKVDPNHLILGARFHNPAYRFPSLFEAAGRHVDVVSVNYYNVWTPDHAMLQTWAGKSGKPFIITEWYAKASDSGLANTGGAGWLVKTQRDRGFFYQNFTLALLESRSCVGWDWFKYIDNDPDDKRTDPSNRDSNKGIVTNRYESYQPLLDAMKDVNQRAFGLIRHFDQPNQTSSR
jgi:hypothetical protein